MTGPIPINLAVEDELSEAVLHRLLSAADRSFAPGDTFRRRGFGYLKTKAAAWNRMAAYRPLLLLTDLDKAPCPLALRRSWIVEPEHPNLHFRVAVREVEAWLLADIAGIQALTGVKGVQLPADPDDLVDPKQELLSWVRKSWNKDLRDQLLPKPGSTAEIGREYNLVLSRFARETWRPDQAARRSRSLARTLTRLNELQPHWPVAPDARD